MNPTVSRLLVHPLVFAARGEPVAARLRELERTQWLPPERLRDLQAAKLRVVLERAWGVPFYRDLWTGAGLTPADVRGPADLARLPEIRSDDLPRLRAALGKPSRRLVRRRTTGTTGRPNTVLADPAANAWTLAARHRAQAWHGVRIGDRQLRLWGRALGETARPERLKDVALNRVRLDGTALTAAAFPRTLARLRDFAPHYAYGYPSLLAALADRLAAAGAGLPLKCAIVTAETSLAFERRRLAERLGCPVVEEYGCSEMEIVAFECPERSRHLVAENVLVEVVDPGRHREGVGELILTDLNNLAMPLVRYRIGDLGSIAAGGCACGRGLPVLGELAGRLKCNYVFTPTGARVHTGPFAYLFERMAEQGLPIARFRTVQEEADLVLFYVVLEREDAEAGRRIEQRLRRETERVLAGSMRCEVRFVPELPPFQGIKASHFESRVADAGAAPEP